MNNLLKLFLLVLCTYNTNLFAQRVFIDENVSRFNATVFEETDQDAKVNWEIYMTDNLNPTISGNWRQTATADSAVFVFKKLDSRQAATFTYRIIEDSTQTKFKYSGSRSDFIDPITYMFVEDMSEANMIICLTPNKRYSKIPNIYFIPTISALKNWLSRAGFENIEVIAITTTTSEEQRKTKWSFDQSLEDFLDPNDRTKTVEGYPAPKRVYMKARKIQ